MAHDLSLSLSISVPVHLLAIGAYLQLVIPREAESEQGHIASSREIDVFECGKTLTSRPDHGDLCRRASREQRIKQSRFCTWLVWQSSESTKRVSCRGLKGRS